MGVTRENRELFYYGYIEDDLEQLEDEVQEQENINQHHSNQRKKKNANKNRGKYGSYGKQHDNVAYGIKRRTGVREARRCENKKIPLLDTDIEFLQRLKDCPISYLACQPYKNIQTEHGLQNVGSALAYQMPLIQPIEEPSYNVAPCGNLKFPQNPNIDQLACVSDNSDKWTHLSVSQEEAVTVEQNTRDQSKCEIWHRERRNRITASNFGRFMIRKAAITDKFIENILTPREFKSASTSYGINNEKVAINMFRKKTGFHVHECGFVVNPLFPFIGATPDGKVCDDGVAGILEVKCPFSIRDWKIDEALNSYQACNKLFLELRGNSVCLKKNHIYYYQVQGQLLVTAARFCDFVTFTRQDLNIERIYPDKAVMESILSKMCVVYVNHVFAKHLLSLIEKEDGSEIEMDLYESSNSAFAELFMEQDKMKIWNDFVNSSEEEQENILQGNATICYKNDDEKEHESWEEIPDLRAAHPAYTGSECFDRIDKKIKSYLKRRQVPVGMLANMEEDVISFFKDFPTSVYIPKLSNSFERMMLHALCQYLDLTSKSYDDGKCRQTQVENKNQDFLMPTTLLSQYLQKNYS